MIRSFENRAEQKISGFQSPAADYLEGRLDIAERLVIDPHSTFYFRMEGTEMQSFGVLDGDILITDRSLKPAHGALIIAFSAGCFTCRICLMDKNGIALKNDHNVLTETEVGVLQIWGVVTAVCRNVLPSALKIGRYSHVCAL